ncbi:MAG: DUF2065 domain-containing protein [Afipia sp.]|nr:DUF2065 domain-containing protein [Afipia sp.]
MRSVGFHDFLAGFGILLMLEGLLFAAFPNWMRKAMQSAMASPDNILRTIGLISAVAGLVLIWLVRR